MKKNKKIKKKYCDAFLVSFLVLDVGIALTSVIITVIVMMSLQLGAIRKTNLCVCVCVF